MSVPVPVSVLRVFCGADGRGGNELGVVLDGPQVAVDDRQALAAHLGYAETVFVDDRQTGRVRIFTPEVELPFAGHPALGTAWLLHEEGDEVEALLTPAGRVPVGARDGELAVAAPPEWCPPFELGEHPDGAAVDALEPVGEGWRYEWGWLDEDAGLIRARAFVPEAGIPEDEATGSAAILLCAAVGRPIEVRQGRASVIRARPLVDGFVEIAGRIERA